MTISSAQRSDMTVSPDAHGIPIEILSTVKSVAQRAAEVIVAHAEAAIAERGRFVLALSGGHTPWLMLRALATAKLPWSAVHIAQVDERVAPSGHPDRNLTHIHESLLTDHPLSPRNLYEMGVEAADLAVSAQQYSRTLEQLAGLPPVLDLIHLGLGPDGHTASLIPGDPVLEVADHDVALTNTYLGRRRMTLTYPIINRARRILWVVTGKEKTSALDRFLRADPSLPASRVCRSQAALIADYDAAGYALSESAR